MREKVFSRCFEIPHGNALPNFSNGCLVLEGGAFRGLYTQGVLDTLMENNLNFECVIGVSAGALGGMNYVSGQIGRSARANLCHRHDSSYVGLNAIKKSQSLIRIEYLFDEFEKLEPIDKKRFYNPNQRFIAVVTSLKSGKTVYFEKGKCFEMAKAIQASATMPFVSKPVTVEGEEYFDGGCSCKIPIDWALNEGYEKIIVVKTRETGFACGGKKMKAAALYKSHPQFSKALEESNKTYFEECEKIDKLSREGRVFVIAPSKKVEVSAVESNMEKLGELYFLGTNDMKRNLPALKNYLERI